jgi:hypothetical protein
MTFSLTEAVFLAQASNAGAGGFPGRHSPTFVRIFAIGNMAVEGSYAAGIDQGAGGSAKPMSSAVNAW